MHRLTAKLLLLFTLLGSFVPTALAAMSATPHACCLRKAHHCHEAGQAPTDRPVFHDAACCNHDCCRALTSSQWAHPQPDAGAATAPHIEFRIALSRPIESTVEFFASRSSRAPPSC
jgi:hypothetical protein